MASRRSPRRNVDASTFVQWLDNRRSDVLDIDRVHRAYIHGVWLDPDTRRELRRYRNQTVRSIRPETAERILNIFNYTLEDYNNGHTQGK